MNDTIELRKLHSSFIGQNLKNLRLKHKVQADALSKLIGKTRQAYSYYERGLRQIDIESLVTLADFYDVTVDFLISNSHTLRSNNSLTYRTYEINGDSTYAEGQPTVISTIYSDVIIVKVSDQTSYFFEKCQVLIEGKIMLFDFHDTVYVAQIHKMGKIGFFYHNEIQIELKERDFEDLSYIGVFMGELKKDYQLECFF